MKNLFILCLALAMITCTADNVTPTAPVNSTFDTSKATSLKKGTLVGVGHTASGEVNIYNDNGKYVIVLDPYSSQSGPDLKVYLSKDINASEYINAGKLQSTTGKQSYTVPGTPDIGEYHFVHIWCEQFTVVFGRAELK